MRRFLARSILAAALLHGLYAQIPVTYRVSTYAGLPANRAVIPTQLFLRGVGGVARDSRGNLYIADSGNYLVRLITPDGHTGVVAGDGYQGYTNGAATAAGARIGSPAYLALDRDRYLYFNDSLYARIYQVDLASGILTMLAGGGESDADDIPGPLAKLDPIIGLGVDRSGDVI